MSGIRLYVPSPLASDGEIDVAPAQAHYLDTVMRRGVGDVVRVFNGADGEWQARLVALARGKARVAVESRLREPAAEPDLWLLFTPLKRDTTDLVVQKATELGVSVLAPVTTERTNAARVNADRLLAIAIEAAEQSERLTVPAIRPLRTLAAALADWTDHRPLFVALERDQLPPAPAADGPVALLVGPEGGFGPLDRSLLDRADFVRPVSLGRRILRAETAVIVGLALLQRPVCG